jgi:heat shock 70kDa protein 4
LYEDGEDATKAQYVAKMDEIRAMAGPIVQRYNDKLEAERQAKAAEEAEKRAAEEAKRKAEEDAKKAAEGEDTKMEDAEATDKPAEVEEK